MSVSIKILLGIMLGLPALLFAENDFGAFEDAKKTFPQYFERNAVGEAKTLNGDEVYYYNGTAEQFFHGSDAEPDSDLWREAEIDAKSKLFQFFKKKDKTVEVTVEIKTPRLAYRWKEGDFYRALYVVDKSNLMIKRTAILQQEVAKDDLQPRRQSQEFVRPDIQKDAVVKEDLPTQKEEVRDSIEKLPPKNEDPMPQAPKLSPEKEAPKPLNSINQLPTEATPSKLNPAENRNPVDVDVNKFRDSFKL